MKEKVRFAPSPTGPLHIGGLKTALINFLYAKKNKGTFILRIEDTDEKRKIEGSEEYIKNSLKWLAIGNEKMPCSKQSERKNIYATHIRELIEKEKAYYCFETKESLEKKRKDINFKYNAQNRHLFKNSLTIKKENLELLLKKEKFVVRLKTEKDKIVQAKDTLRGNISINTNELEDKILLKEDGFPTYHFANVVDDFEMKITTVIRGEEWIASLPIHSLIYDAFGWEPPSFIHLPLILNPSGKGKLSKRHGEKLGFSVFPLSDEKMNIIGLKEKGILADALLNYLALLGWNPKNDIEILDTQELINSFDINGLQKKGAAFDYNKLLWINQQHIKKKNAADIFLLYTDIALNQGNKIRFEQEYSGEEQLEIIDSIKDRIKTLIDIDAHIEYFVNPPGKYDENDIKKIIKTDLDKERAFGILNDIEKTLKKSEAEVSKQTFLNFLEGKKVSLGFVMQLLRIALVGKLFGIDLFKIIKIIKKKETIRRIKKLSLHLINLKK